MRFHARTLALFAAAAFTSCHAVVIAAGDGSGNTTAPVDDFGFANVGRVDVSSGIYLGNRWVLTANHVAGALPPSATFNGIAYNTVPGSHQRLTNGGAPGMSAFTDMVVFRLDTDPGIAAVNLPTITVGTAETVAMAGAGRDRETTETHWNVTVNPGPANDVWTETAPPADRSGFETVATTSLRHGRNEVSANGLTVAGDGDVRAFSTTFDTLGGGGFTDEAQAVLRDSGGGVFHKNAGTWELVGMIFAVATFENQPGGSATAVYGNQTYAADIAFYAPQIIAITGVPEPSRLLLLGISSFSLARRRRR